MSRIAIRIYFVLDSNFHSDRLDLDWIVISIPSLIRVPNSHLRFFDVSLCIYSNSQCQRTTCRFLTFGFDQFAGWSKGRAPWAFRCGSIPHLMGPPWVPVLAPHGVLWPRHMCRKCVQSYLQEPEFAKQHFSQWRPFNYAEEPELRLCEGMQS